MYTHLGLMATPSCWIRPMDKPWEEAAAPDFSKRILARIYVSAQAPSHLIAFGKDFIGASPGPQGNCSKSGE